MTHSALCEGADLCEEIAGSADTSFTRTYQGEPPSRTILQTDEFVLMADMSPLTVGHVLLLPRAHYFSFSALLRTHLSELEHLMASTVPFYSDTFGEPLVLEHGSAPGSGGGACVTHAHWHLVPVDGHAVDDLIHQDGLPCTELAELAELGRPRFARQPYFYVSYKGAHRVYEPSPATRRQYLRSIAGRVLAIEDPEWDYALVIRKQCLRDTMAMTRSWFR
jgi:diadenosine tetraphosphate (Ap4A) HIT family hydrolase